MLDESCGVTETDNSASDIKKIRADTYRNKELNSEWNLIIIFYYI